MKEKIENQHQSAERLCDRACIYRRRSALPTGADLYGMYSNSAGNQPCSWR